MRKVLVAVALGAAVVGVVAAPAAACGGLVAPNGTVRLLETTTMAGYHDGVEHYVTSFKFAGDGAAFGSIVPLPGVPSNVERGGDWTLQRLVKEYEPPQPKAFAQDGVAAASTSAPAQVLLQKRIDALDITILKGGGKAVGDWARQHGFQLTPDAPEVLDFYGDRSPIFLAAQFDGKAASALGQGLGDGTPIHLTIPTPNPWVPLRILGLGRGALEPVRADVFVLTDREPGLLAGDSARVMRLDVSGQASSSLLDDLRSDKGMEWVPDHMWVSRLRIDGAAGELRHDLAIDADGGNPSARAAGMTVPESALVGPTVPVGEPKFVHDVRSRHSAVDTVAVLTAGAGLALLVVLVGVAWRARPSAPPASVAGHQ